MSASLLALLCIRIEGYDGRVEVELQGEPLNVNMFVSQISKQPWIEITNVEESDQPVNKSEKKFTVRYY